MAPSATARPGIELRRALVTSASPERVFATLCDLPAAASWLPNCTSIEVLDGEPVSLGSKLRYSYRERGHDGSLACSVSAFVPGQRMTIEFSDPRVEASLDFVLEDRAGSTTIHHTVELVPKSFAVRVLVGIIRRVLPGRMDTALHALVQAANARDQ